MPADLGPSSEDAALRYERVGDHIALVTINRPDARNAVDEHVAAGIDAAVKASEADDDIWAVVITGAGDKAFCAGADLKAIAAGKSAALASKDGGFAGITRAQRTKLWIAAVNGAALAGGCEIVLSCDLVVAVRTATFGVPETKRGLIAAAGGVFRLPRVLPKAVAMELIATGEALPAERAHQLGFVNRLVEPGEARAAGVAFAEEICRNAPLAVRESLSIARRAYDLDEAALWSLNDEGMRRVMKSEDFKEGPRAFIEKRPPNWVGR